MANDLVLNDLLEAGAHFGHQTNKWNPKMKKYVFGERNGIYVIDLAKTIPLAKKAADYLKKVSAEGRPVLFVGTKRQSSEVISTVAKSCNSFHVTNRWLGGMLTNFKTINLSIDKLKKVEKMKANGDFDLLTKKERIKVEKDVVKLERNLGGIKNMRKMPGAIVIIDPNNEQIAVKEARTLGIPIVALVDTNCDPSEIDYVVPGNDDAIKSVTLFTNYFAAAIMEGGKGRRTVKTDDGRDLSLENEIISKYEKDIDLKGTEEL